MAWLGFFPNFYAAAGCFEPASVELHQAGTFWRTFYWLSYRAAVHWNLKLKVGPAVNSFLKQKGEREWKLHPISILLWKKRLFSNFLLTIFFLHLLLLRKVISPIFSSWCHLQQRQQHKTPFKLNKKEEESKKGKSERDQKMIQRLKMWLVNQFS